MRFHTRKWVKPEDLNPSGTLFGGRLLAWIDEEAALYTIIQFDHSRVVTKFMSEINFMSSAKQGDIVEIGIEVIKFGKKVNAVTLDSIIKFGKTSLTLKCEVRNKMTRETIITVDQIIMVNVDENGVPKPHGKTKVEFVKDRLESKL